VEILQYQNLLVAPAAKFYGEDEPVSLSVAGFEKVTLKPRHFAAGIPVTKAMRLSNSNIDRYVTDEILRYCSNVQNKLYSHKFKQLYQ
jgi:hypothetical protein